MISDGPNTQGIVQAAALTKRFGELTAVDSLDLSIPYGAAFAFVGPNGAGKTTFMRMICGLARITSGSLAVDGKTLPEELAGVKRVIGVVPQESNLDHDLDVRENLLVWARYFELPAKAAAQRADELLGFMKLEEKRNAPVLTLSGGMKRRLLIARALMNEPKLLILDEPTTGLDPLMRSAIWDRLRDLRARGMTLLITTHYMEEARAVADTVAVMSRGRIVALGSADELSRAHGGSLEEVFMALTGEDGAHE